MAKKTMTASLSSLRAQRYEGQYAATDGTVSVQGDFSTNASKEIESVSGEVSVAGEIVGTFNAYRNGEGLRYSINNVEMANIDTVVGAISPAIEAITNQVNQGEQQ